MPQFQYLPLVEPFPQPQEQIPFPAAEPIAPYLARRSALPQSSLFAPVLVETLGWLTDPAPFMPRRAAAVVDLSAVFEPASVVTVDWLPLDDSPVLRPRVRFDSYVRPEVVEVAPTVTVDMWLFTPPLIRPRVPVPHDSTVDWFPVPDPIVICPYIPLRPAEGDKTAGQAQNTFEVLGRVSDNTNTVQSPASRSTIVGRRGEGATSASRVVETTRAVFVAPGQDVIVGRAQEDSAIPGKPAETTILPGREEEGDSASEKEADSDSAPGRTDECR